VAITGDLTMRARHREFAAACDWILSLDAAVTVEVGNHDLPYFNLFERFTDPYRRFRRIEALVERAIRSTASRSSRSRPRHGRSRASTGRKAV
jgi:3',5'-cyclic AMP phosphodiesterase CpdA